MLGRSSRLLPRLGLIVPQGRGNATRGFFSRGIGSRSTLPRRLLRVWLPGLTLGAVGALVFAVSGPEQDEPPKESPRKDYPWVHAAPWLAPPSPSLQPDIVLAARELILTTALKLLPLGSDWFLVPAASSFLGLSLAAVQWERGNCGRAADTVQLVAQAQPETMTPLDALFCNLVAECHQDLAVLLEPVTARPDPASLLQARLWTLNMYIRISGHETYEYIATATINVARAYGFCGDHARKKERLERVAYIQERLYEDGFKTHAKYIQGRLFLASAHAMLGEWNEAAAVVDAVLAVVEQREDMQDWQTVTTIAPLLRAKALIQNELGRPEERVQLLMRALKLLEDAGYRGHDANSCMEVRVGKMGVMADLAIALFHRGQILRATELYVDLVRAARRLADTTEQMGEVAERGVTEATEPRLRPAWAFFVACFTFEQSMTSLLLAMTALGEDHLKISAVSECPSRKTTRVEEGYYLIRRATILKMFASSEKDTQKAHALREETAEILKKLNQDGHFFCVPQGQEDLGHEALYARMEVAKLLEDLGIGYR